MQERKQKLIVRTVEGDRIDIFHSYLGNIVWCEISVTAPNTVNVGNAD